MASPPPPIRTAIFVLTKRLTHPAEGDTMMEGFNQTRNQVMP